MLESVFNSSKFKSLNTILNTGNTSMKIVQDMFTSLIFSPYEIFLTSQNICYLCSHKSVKCLYNLLPLVRYLLCSAIWSSTLPTINLLEFKANTHKYWWNLGISEVGSFVVRIFKKSEYTPQTDKIFQRTYTIKI